MAFAKGRQPQDETAKTECLRRWPHLMLRCEAVYYNGKREGFVVTWDDLSYGGRRTIFGGSAKSAPDAWVAGLARLEEKLTPLSRKRP